MAGLWTNWPTREIDGIMKGYMIAQWAFWLQQIIVINIEERRKDHWQMFSHHIVTTSLITACYSYYQTRVGHFILVLMDVVDLFLPVRILFAPLLNCLLSNLLTPILARQVPEIRWIHHNLRCSVRRLHVLVDFGSPCHLQHGLLVRLRRPPP